VTIWDLSFIIRLSIWRGCRCCWRATCQQ